MNEFKKRGRGRPPSENPKLKYASCRVTAEIYNEIKKKSSSISEFVMDAVMEKLKNS